MPLKSGKMNRQEQVFVETVAETGNPVYAAAIAGYRQPQPRASQNLAKPAIQAEIRARELARLHNDLLPASMNILALALNPNTAGVPWGSRITAAKIVQDRVFSPAESAGRKDLSDMSADELKAAMQELQDRLANMAKPVIEGSPAPVEEPIVDEPGAFD